MTLSSSPLPEEDSPRPSPGGVAGNLLLNKIKYEIPHVPRILYFIMNNFRERERKGP